MREIENGEENREENRQKQERGEETAKREAKFVVVRSFQNAMYHCKREGTSAWASSSDLLNSCLLTSSRTLGKKLNPLVSILIPLIFSSLFPCQRLRRCCEKVLDSSTGTEAFLSFFLFAVTYIALLFTAIRIKAEVPFLSCLFLCTVVLSNGRLGT
jgi:hypothetical protein